VTRRLVKAAAIVAFVQGVAHGAVILLGTPSHGPEESMVVDTMKRYVFNFSGAHRTYWDLYLGYALLAAVTCLLEAALLWLMAPLAITDPARLRLLLMAVVVSVIVHACLVLRFFFYVPLATDFVITVLLSLSILGSRSAGGRAAPTGIGH
jgi:hypothetical protein